MSQHLEIWQVTEPRRPSAARAATMQQSEFGFFWQADGGEDHGPFSTFDEAHEDFRRSQAIAKAFEPIDAMFSEWFSRAVERQ